MKFSAMSKTYRVATCDYFQRGLGFIANLSRSKKSERAGKNDRSSRIVASSIEKYEAREFFDWEVKYNRWPLSILGLWPLDDGFIERRFFVCFILIMIYSVPSIVRLAYIASDASFDRPIQIVNEVIPLLYIIGQTIAFKSKSSRIKIILKRMYVDWKISLNLTTDLRQPMIVYGARTRLINLLLMGFFFLSCVGYYAEPFVTMMLNGDISRKALPNKGLYPFSTDISPNYEIVYMMQTILGTLCAIAIISIDGFLVLSVFHGCAQLAMLSKKIAHHDGRTRHSETSKKNSSTSFRGNCSCLKCIVDHHVSVSEYVKMIDDAFHEIILMRLMTNTINFCSVGYNIVKSNEDSNFGNLLLNVIYLITMTLNFVLYCWCGEQLAEEGENVGRTIYELEWYNKKSKIAQSLILPIIYSRRILKITAGRFFVMSFTCYKEWIVKSLGYLSVLLALKSHN